MADNFKINQTSVMLKKDDLTAMDVEAFVFYAETDLALGSGYGNAISMRGGPSIKAELDELGSVEKCAAVVTGAGELKAKNIIHAVGPGFQEDDTENKLRKTVDNVLKSADEKGITQVAFPIMGIGFYGIPVDTSLKIMAESIKAHCSNGTGLKEIIICANDNRELRFLTEKFEIS